MRKLIIATMAATGVLAGTAGLASAAIKPGRLFIGPPGTVVQGHVGNCKWRMQGGERAGHIAFTHLSYLGPQCTRAGFLLFTPAVRDTNGGHVDLDSCPFPRIRCNPNLGQVQVDVGVFSTTSTPGFDWTTSEADVCGVVPGMTRHVCQQEFLERPSIAG